MAFTLQVIIEKTKNAKGVSMKAILALLILSAASFSTYASEKWTKLSPTVMQCSYVEGDSYQDTFMILQDSAVIFSVKGSGKIGLRKMYTDCMAAKALALDERTTVYVNLESGDVLPEDGFFIRRKPDLK